MGDDGRKVYTTLVADAVASADSFHNRGEVHELRKMSPCFVPTVVLVGIFAAPSTGRQMRWDELRVHTGDAQGHRRVIFSSRVRAPAANEKRLSE